MPRSTVLNGYDLIKTFAVIIMIADHIGYYFFPEELWWRAVGRIGFPVWFFLVGHARGRDISLKLLGGAALLVAFNMVAGMSVFPLNALFTIIILRLVIDSVATRLKADPRAVWPMTMLMTVLILPTDMLTEYGTIALMFALFGYLVRHAQDLPYTDSERRSYAVVITAVFIMYQWLTFGFELPEFLFMALGTAGVSMLLMQFQGQSYPALDAKTPAPIKALCQFCGRHTLEIYVVHLALFKMMALWMGLEGYDLLQPSLIGP